MNEDHVRTYIIRSISEVVSGRPSPRFLYSSSTRTYIISRSYDVVVLHIKSSI